MQNSKSWIIWVVVIIVVIIVVGFVIKNSGPKESPITAPIAGTEDVLPLTLYAKHLYLNGTHTYRGIVVTPTPCYDVLTGVIAGAGSLDDANVPVQTIKIDTKDKGMNCGQVVTSKEFKISFDGPVDLPVNVTLNGKPAILNVMEVESEAELSGEFDFKS